MKHAIHARPEDIPIGRGNAVTAEALAAIWGCNPRAARDAVARLRALPSADGMVICSDTRSSGFWRTDDPEEIQTFIISMERRARFTFSALRSARAALRNEGQQRFYM